MRIYLQGDCTKYNIVRAKGGEYSCYCAVGKVILNTENV